MSNITPYNPFEDFFADFGKGFWPKRFAFPAGAELAIKLDDKDGVLNLTLPKKSDGTARRIAVS